MHIGFITSHFPFRDAKSVGGIGTSIKNLGAALSAQGHNVSVFVYGQKTEESFEEDGLQLHLIKNAKVPGISGFATRKRIEKRIRLVHRSQKLDIVEAPDWIGPSAFISIDCPLVVRLHGSDTYFCHLEGRKVRKHNYFYESRALRQADGILSVSRYTAQVTFELFGLKKDFEVIPNGIDCEVFKPSEIKTHQPIILYVGGIIRKKGVIEIPHYFNRVIESFPDAKLLIVGKDMPDSKTQSPSTQRLMESALSEKAVANTTFTGTIPYSEIAAMLESASVCIFPSYAEALPASWMEAMALEKAIVASNVGWSPEMIENGVNGFAVSPGDHEAFANRILEFLKNPELRDRMGRNARQKAKADFSSDVVARHALAYYTKITTQWKR